MGMFRTVWANLPCRRCGVPRRVGVQFKTGDDGLEDYEEGAPVPASHELRPGDVHEGLGERYCRACYRAFQADLARAHADALAWLVESGRCVLTEKGMTDPVPADDIRRIGHDRAAVIAAGLAKGEPRIHVIAFDDRSHDVIWDGRTAKFYNDAWGEFVEARNQAVDAAMRGLGWMTGSEQYEDYKVVVDGEMRLFVAEPL